MGLVHSYVLTARDGSEADLEQALRDLGAAVKGIAGSEGTMVLRDRKDSAKFQFLEFWTDEGARNAAGSQLPKDVMGRLMASVGGPIQMAGYDQLAE